MSEITLTTTADGLVLVHGEDLLGRYRVSDDSITPVNTPKPYFHPLHTQYENEAANSSQWCCSIFYYNTKFF